MNQSMQGNVGMSGHRDFQVFGLTSSAAESPQRGSAYHAQYGREGS
jgi:hypothetical protein